MGTIEQNKELSKAYLKALGEGLPDLGEEILAPDFYAYAPGTAKICGRRDRDEVIAFMASVPTMFKDGIHFEWQTITADEDRVVCQVKGSSTLASGVTYGQDYIFLFTCRDGKIIRQEEYIDTLLADETLMLVMDEQGVK
jgi:ketosteroid isomerase-like protein